MEAQEKEAPRRGVESVRVAGQILQAMLRLGAPARLKDIEQATGIASPTLHRYLISLIDCGLVQRAERSSRYEFGLLAHQIGQRAGRGKELVELFAPAVRELSDAIGETCAIGVWLDHGAAIAEWFESSKAVNISLRAGQRLPLPTSSTAQALAAWLPREKTEPVLRAELSERGALTEQAVAAFYQAAARARKVGIVRGLGQQVPGISSLSVPVFDRSLGVVAALSAIGNEATFRSDPDGPVGLGLRTLSERLSRLLGAPDRQAP